MFLEILETLLKVLAVFSVLFVAFGLSFFILLSHVRLLKYIERNLRVKARILHSMEKDVA